MERTTMNEIYLVSSGDLRLSANQKCWQAQADMEQALQQGQPLAQLSRFTDW